jgi:nucleoside-diphosphate-sugar epimerase
MKTILLTGATGEVGSQLAKRLNSLGFKVYCIVRSKHKMTPKERLMDILGNDVVEIQGDLTLERCGFSLETLKTYRNYFSAFIHCAAIVKFDASLEQQIMATNVAGTARALELAQTLNIPNFHFVSTAYVAGAASNFSEHDIGLAQHARNLYELSKQKAEALVRAWPGNTAIYRLSIVVGDSSTGATDSYNGFYGYLSGFWQMREQLNHAAVKPFLVPANATSTMNLVPRDWVTDMLAKLIGVALQNKTYHLTHPEPASVGWMMETSFKYLNLPVTGGLNYKGEGAPWSNDSHDLEPTWCHIQKLILRSLKRYAFYTEHEASFGHEELKRTLGQAYYPPRSITQPFLELLLDYAIRQNFSCDEPKNKQPHLVKNGESATFSDRRVTRELLRLEISERR